MTTDLERRFLTNTDDTGRFVVYSFKTGICYYVEPLLGGEKRDFGNINPATGKVEGSYGDKYVGAIHRRDSLITEDNGFKNIVELPAGTSPLGEINRIDDIRYEEGYRPKVANG